MQNVFQNCLVTPEKADTDDSTVKLWPYLDCKTTFALKKNKKLLKPFFRLTWYQHSAGALYGQSVNTTTEF